MKKRLVILLIAVMAFMMAAPAAVFATDPPAPGTTGGTLSVEYVYVDGQNPNIPNEITRFGFRYYLVSQAPPVLSATLPNVREYTYRIEGALLPEQRADIEGLGNVTFNPVYVIFETEANRERVIKNMPTNDVDNIEKFWSFNDIKQGNLDGTNVLVTQELEFTGVTFDITAQEDIPGPGDLLLPTGYTATVVYRGVESYSVLGYYLVNMEIVIEEELDVDSYTIVAEYQTDEMPPPIDITDTLVPQGPGAGGDGGGGLTEEEAGLLTEQGNNPFQNIIDGLVPQGNFSVTNAWSFISMVLSVASVAIAAIYVLSMIGRKKREKTLAELDTYGEEKTMTMKRSTLLKLLTIIVGVMTPVMWLYLDDLTLGMVWINAFTPIVGILCGLTVALVVVTKVRAKKAVEDDDEGGVAEPELTVA